MSEEALRSPDEFESLLAEGELSGRLVQEMNLTGVAMDNARMADVAFRRVGMHQTDASSCEWSRVRFSESSMRGAVFSGGRMRACSLFSSELIEARFERTTLTATQFFGCGMGNAVFDGARLQSVAFEGCELFAARFARALLMNTRFVSSERGAVPLDRADLSHAILVDCDLQGANLFSARFDHALLVKVDLRHANLAGATFEGARLIDVSVDTSLLEPEQARAIEAARVRDPWRDPSLMSAVLAMHGEAELSGIVDALLRTYVIEGGQASAPLDSFPAVLAQLYSQYDFPELDHLRVSGTSVEARVGGQWQPLGAGAATSSPRPAPEVAAPPEAPRDDPGTAPAPEPAQASPEPSEPAPAPAESAPPKNVSTSKRFRRLEMD